MENILIQTRRPDITFYRSGQICISSRVANLLGLVSGDVINICKDNDEFLLFIQSKSSQCIGRHKGMCYQTSKRGRHFCVNSVALSHAILNYCHIESTKASFYIGSPITQYGDIRLPIITRKPII